MKNFFSIFQQEPTFFVDKTNLRKKYLHLIKEYQNHEDLENLSILHLAYKTLNDEELLLEYFLKIWGLIKENENNEFQLSQDFLMEMMDFNEAIEMGNTSVYEQIHNLIDNNLNEVKELFKKELTEENKKLIAQKYFERKYLKRLMEKS